MGIGDQIKQREFESELQKAIINIAFTNSYMSGLISNSFKVHNISIQQFNVLRILQGQHPKPVSINDITLRMVDKMSNASRLVDKLFTKSLISRKSCSYDKRQVDISITPAGQSKLLELNDLIAEVYSNHNHLTEEEFKTLNLLLDKLRLD
ncbi:MAG: MarR family transcriptional regulator [Bacteroidetes bacterium]|nr:MAG: MarR family transcriptional regulator [Bacteroidota bacterium]